MGQHEELIQIFTSECRENIELLDQKIVALESEPDNRALLDDIFRAFHTLKGNAGIVGMRRFEKIAHITEEVLTQIRDGKREIDGSIVTFLLDSLDQLKILHAAIEETGDDRAVSDAPPETGTKKTESAAAGKKPKTAAKKKPKSAGLRKTGKRRGSTSTEDAGTAAAGIAAPAAAISAETTAIPAGGKTASAADGWHKADSIVRVDVAVLDNLMNMVGELVLSRNQIMQFVQHTDDSGFHAAGQRLSLCTSELQESIMQTRMQPISTVFGRLPRLVRDLTHSSDKQVTLKVEGEETELDKTIIEGIRDPLVHLVRNAIDHGIESEAIRRACGKDLHGSLTLRAYHEGGQVNLEIIDDGAGIDLEKIRAKAVEKGLIPQAKAHQLSERDALNLIFQPGFSTAATVTNISGRGVGMDVVKTNIEEIGGDVEISSRVGEGTTVRIKIPLTLAIIPALLVSAGGQRFAIPQVNLLELVLLEGAKLANIERLGDAEVYRLRGNLLPLLRLDRVLELSGDRKEEMERVSIVVLAVGPIRFGLIVDKIHDAEEIVVKPLSRHMKRVRAFAGATVMGDGKVALILDAVGLAATARIIMEKHRRVLDSEATGARAQTQTQSYLLFSVNDCEQLALPLGLVSRLETFDVVQIQEAAGRECMKYRGRILPLLRIENYLNIQAPIPGDTFSAIVIATEAHEVGLVVSKILDIVDAPAEIDRDAMPQNGILGTVLIRGRVTLIIDAFSLISREFPGWFARKPQGQDGTTVQSVAKVLLVDDSPFIRAIERSYLEADGYTVCEAGDGAEAMKMMDVAAVDIVVTDIEMPTMDGLELAREIRAKTETRELPIVAVSSLAGPEDVARGREAGIDIYLKKLNRDEFLASVQEVSNRGQKAG